jgi:hypothetical protein
MIDFTGINAGQTLTHSVAEHSDDLEDQLPVILDDGLLYLPEFCNATVTLG